MELSPLISICIPTYNRSSLLQKTLQSIVSQGIFKTSKAFEIVVSDNCSTDDTLQVLLNFRDMFPGKFRFEQSRENRGPEHNVNKALSLGRGELLKLNNDTLAHAEGSLESLLKAFSLSSRSKPVLFFSKSISHSDNLNELTSEYFIDNVGIESTWIGAFSIWRDDLPSFGVSWVSLLITDFLLSYIGSKGHVRVVSNIGFNSLEPEKKGGYNLMEVFVEGYLGIIKFHYRNSSSFRIYRKQQRLVLFAFLLPWLIEILRKPEVFTFRLNNFSSKYFRGFRGLWFAYISFPIFWSIYCLIALRRLIHD